MRYVLSRKSSRMWLQAAMMSMLLLGACSTSTHKAGTDAPAAPAAGLEAGSASGPDATLVGGPTSETSDKPLVVCNSNPGTGDRCAPLPSGKVCRQAMACGGGCGLECSCMDGVWRCAGPVCRDYSIACGTPPICDEVCGFGGPGTDVDGGMDHPAEDRPELDAAADRVDGEGPGEAGGLDGARPDGAGDGPVVACESKPVTGDRCAPLPSGKLCRQGEMCGGGCAIECSCAGGRWRCEGPVCRDYFVVTDGGRSVAPCGTPPLCDQVCGFGS
jgi:hypothetical protein